MDGGEGEVGPLLGSDMTCLLMLTEEGILASNCCGQVNKILVFLLLLVWNADVLLWSAAQVLMARSSHV